MKDKKFVVFCILGIAWLAIFVATLFGAKIHPRMEVVVAVLCVGWFAYWTLSTLFGTTEIKIEPTKESNTENGNAAEETPESK